MAVSNELANYYTARDLITEATGQAVPGIDLIEVLADALTTYSGMEGTPLKDIQELVITVARQRNEINSTSNTEQELNNMPEYKPSREYIISKTHTLDGYKVVPGMHVWDYDLRPRIVGEEFSLSVAVPDGPRDDPWWDMLIPYGEHAGKLGSSMNPSRMWKFHPHTGLGA